MLAAAHAAHGSDRDPAAAQALFEQARIDVAAGKYDSACPRFRESFRLDPAVGTLLNVADCTERLGLIAAALAYFADALGQLAPQDDRVKYAQARIARLEPRVPRLQIDAASGEPMTVARDQLPMGPTALNVMLPVEVGHHTIVVRATGHEDRVFDVDLVEGAREHVRAEPGERLAIVIPAVSRSSTPASAAPATLPATPAARTRVLRWVSAGVGAAGLATGAVAGIVTLREVANVEATCPTHSCRGSAYQSASNSATTGQALATVSTTGFVVGFVGIAAAAVLWLYPTTSTPGPATGEQPARTDSLQRAARGWLAPWGGPTSLGLAAGGSFD
jgi:hypothetical protein